MPAVTKDTGLGTTYERVAVAQLLEDLGRRYTIGSVLEGPTDGITGIRGLNSVPLAQAGASVELLLGDADEVGLARRAWETLGLAERLTVREATDHRLNAAPRSFDLVWNFNSLPQVKDPDRLVSEMCEASSELVLIVTSNTWNYGFPVHRLHHRAAREEWSHGNIAMMNTRKIEGALAAGGFDVVERLLVDVPWWPDIDSPIEEVAATFLPFLKGLKSGSKRLERYTWTVDTLPYFDADKRAALERELKRHFLIERSRLFPFKILFAHHRGVLARRREGA
jgi:hypothetical protein